MSLSTSGSSIPARWRRIVTATAALAAITVTGAGLAGPADATDGERLAAHITAGAKKPVVTEQIFHGRSTWFSPRGSGPAQTSFLAAFAHGIGNPGIAPPGANDWNCRPARGRAPVVLVHGTWENAYNNWAMLSPALKRAGYCVFALNYGILPTARGGGLGGVLPGVYATGDIAESGAQIGMFVDRVRRATGADTVNMVGHSQGGIAARQYIRYEGGADKVDHMVTLGATNTGTTLVGIGTLGRTINNLGIDVLGPIALLVGASGIQQVYDSPFITNLNRGGRFAIGDVRYTVIGTRYDEVSTPFTRTFFPPGTKNTRNILVQNGCAQDTSDHLALSYSPRAVSLVLNALDRSSPVVCAPNPWLIG